MKVQAEKKEISTDDYLKQLIDEVFQFNSSSNEERELKRNDREYLERKKTELTNKLKELNEKLEKERELKKLIEKLKQERELNEKLEKQRELRELNEKLEKQRNKIKNILKALVESIIEVGHILIFQQDFKNIIEASIEERFNEKQTKTTKTKPKFDPIKGEFDSLISLAVKEIPKQPFCSMTLEEKEEKIKEISEQFSNSMTLEQKIKLFSNSRRYKIASETLESISKSKLKKIFLDRFVELFQDIFATWQKDVSSKSKSASIKFSFCGRLQIAYKIFIGLLMPKLGFSKLLSSFVRQRQE